MNKELRYKKYEENVEVFNMYFKGDAKVYAAVYRDYCIDNMSYEKIGMIYKYAKSTVRNIIQRIEEFLISPEEKLMELDYSVEELAGDIWMPNEFICGCYILSLNVKKVFIEAIYLYQNGMREIIPRSHILSYSTQYKNSERRTALCNELRKFKIMIRNGEGIKVFDSIEDEKGRFRFRFTEECLNYIDPLLYMSKVILEDNVCVMGCLRN